MRTPIPLLLAIGLLLLTGCGTATTAAAPEEERLPDGSWTLTAGRDADGPLALLPDRPVTLEVAGDTVRGQVCNSYSATPATGTGLLLAGLGATEMGCLPAAVMELETRYLAALGAVTTAHGTADELVLSGGDVELQYAATAEPAPVELTGQPWVIDTLISGGGPDSSVASTHGGTTVRFLDGGAVAFDTSCAAYDGTWGPGGELEVRHVATYDATCRDDRDRESRALEALLDGATWEIDGERLTLLGADGAGVGLRAAP